MINQLNFEKKTYLLLVIFVIAFLLGYYASFKKTYEAFGMIRYYETDVHSVNISEVYGLKKKYEKLDSVYQLVKGVEYERLLIMKVGQLLDNYNVELNYMTTEGNFNVIALTGGFHGLCKALYDLETSFHAGGVISSEFSVKIDKPTKNKKLNLILYLKKINTDESKN